MYILFVTVRVKTVVKKYRNREVYHLCFSMPRYANALHFMFCHVHVSFSQCLLHISPSLYSIFIASPIFLFSSSSSCFFFFTGSSGQWSRPPTSSSTSTPFESHLHSLVSNDNDNDNDNHIMLLSQSDQVPDVGQDGSRTAT